MPATVLCAPDKLRGSLSAAAAAAALAAGAREAGLDAVEHPLADGGEGTRDAIVAARGGRLVACRARDARGCEREAAFGLLDDGTAVVEAADAIGLGRLARGDRDPLAASSAGLGDVLRAVLDAGPRRIVVGLGGSATVDGGLGLLVALGAAVLDADGARLEGTGADTERVARLELDGLDPRLADVDLVVALDVTSPLTGPAGAARVFGPQKGADAAAVERLDAGLARLAPLLGPAAGIAGAGAAGGLGAALAFLGAEPRRGADLVMAETGFAEHLAAAALCLTGEGSVDGQTASGKTVARVVEASAAAGVPCFVVAGAVADGAAEPLYALGAGAVVAAGRRPQSLEDALGRAAGDLRATARALCGAFLAGRAAAVAAAG